ncbi:hypothetical protein K445DRAFT_200166 [Daldinia sp. EC12]|nr:hypothetical protein K445DRAFT_200166 [Daldinia sp. EC12]
MQQANHRRLSMLSTPAQDLPTLSANATSSSHKPNVTYSRNPLPIPAAYGYLPQPMWSQEYRSIQGGPRAIPLRMHRGTVNRVESHQIPIQLLQPPSDRPYSVPVYLNHRTSSDSDGSFTHPPRPATSLDLDSADKSRSPHPSVFPQHKVARKTENDLSTLRASAPKGSEYFKEPFRAARPVANRGSQKVPQSSTSTVEGNDREPSPGAIPPEKRMGGVVQGQKRTTSSINGKTNPSKRIKFNVIQNQFQTATTLRTSERLPVEKTSDMELPQTRKTKPISRDAAAKEVDLLTCEESNNNIATTQGLDTAGDITNSEIQCKELARYKAIGSTPPNPYNIINKAGHLEKSQSIRTLRNVQSPRNIETIDISPTANTLTLSNTMPQNLRVENQDLNAVHRQYTDTATQCGILFGAASSEAQVEIVRVSNNNHSHDLYDEAVANSTAKEEGGHRSKSLDLQLSRIGDFLCAQDKHGMDTFIDTKLCSKGVNILETLTNELLLGLAVRDVKLLDDIAKIM